MQVIRARNVNDAWWKAKRLLNSCHIKRPSRVGDVMEAPEAVTTTYTNPTERVLFDPLRNANPFFHLFEALWMLAGRNDIKFVSQFNQYMNNISDDGVTQHGAYGWRWRKAFEEDQLPKIIKMLRENRDERRAVLQMWSANHDLARTYRDVPCNLSVCFKIRPTFKDDCPRCKVDCLSMLVSCRSNDIAWGALGANIVHFSMLQEYLASMIGVRVGIYEQVSDSWHAYTERWSGFGGLQDGAILDYYHSGYGGIVTSIVTPYPLVAHPESFDEELYRWLEGTENPQIDEPTYRNPFFVEVAQPLFGAWLWWKENAITEALDLANRCKATDWRIAAMEWLQRRAEARKAKATQETA